MKFRHTIILCFILCSLIPLYTLGGLAIYHNDVIIQDTVSNSLEMLSRVQIMRLEEFCENRRAALHQLGQTELIQDTLLVSLGEKAVGEQPNAVYVDNLLLERTRNYDYLRSLSLVNRDYLLVSSSDPHPTQIPNTLQSLQEQYQQDFYISSICEHQTENGDSVPVIVVYQRVYHENELIGYLVAEVPISYFDTFRYETNLAEGCSLYVTDENEKIITAGTSEQGNDIREYVTTPEERAEYSKKWSAIDWEQEPTGSFKYTVNGTKYITSYSTIKYTDWKICINADLGVYKAVTKPFWMTLIFLMVVLTLCILALNDYFARHLTKPLNKVTETLQNIQTQDDYSLRIDYKKNDEFGQLSEQIDTMLAYVEQVREAEKQQRLILQERADRDALTGVYNKLAINVKLDESLATAGDAEFFVGFIDVDDFRNYNTLYGHIQGDRVLRFVADTMRTFFGDGTGRNGGDEFLFWGIQEMSDEAFEQHIKTFLQALNTGLEPETPGGNRLSIDCSIGVAVERASDTDRRKLIHHADQSMYCAKQQGKNQYHISRNQEV